MKCIKGILERIEGDIALIEINGKVNEYPKELLPEGVYIGDILMIKEDSIEVDIEETKKRKEKIKNLMESAWED